MRKAPAVVVCIIGCFLWSTLGCPAATYAVGQYGAEVTDDGSLAVSCQGKGILCQPSLPLAALQGAKPLIKSEGIVEGQRISVRREEARVGYSVCSVELTPATVTVLFDFDISKASPGFAEAHLVFPARWIQEREYLCHTSTWECWAGRLTARSPVEEVCNSHVFRRGLFVGESDFLSVAQEPALLHFQNLGEGKGYRLARGLTDMPRAKITVSLQVGTVSELARRLAAAQTQTKRKSENLLSVNPSFEEGLEETPRPHSSYHKVLTRAGDPKGFRIDEADGRKARARLVTDVFKDGSHSLQIEILDSRAEVCIYPTMTPIRAEQDTMYVFSCWARVSNTMTVWPQDWAAGERPGLSGPKLKFFADGATGEALTPWRKLELPVHLKAGQQVNCLRVWATGAPGDKGWIDQLELYEVVPGDYSAANEPHGWRVVPEVAAQMLLNTSVGQGAKKGNLLSDGSFEVAPVGWAYATSLPKSLTEGDSVHGRVAVKLGYNLVESLFVPVRPDRLYTVSAYVKAEKPCVVQMGVFSGCHPMAGQNNKYGRPWEWEQVYGRPGVYARSSVGPEWKRIHFSFIPDYHPRSSLTVRLEPWGQPGGTILVDAVQLEEGTLSDFATQSRLEVGASVDGRDSPDRLLLADAEPVKVKATVSFPGSAGQKVSLDYKLLGYDCAEVVRHIGPRTVQVGPDGRTSDSVSFTGVGNGLWAVVVEAKCRDVSAVSEQVSFGMIPSSTARNLPRDVPFGAAIWQEAYVPAYERIGVRWIRCHSGLWHNCTSWESVEPDQGKYVWRDDLVELAERHNMSLLGSLNTIPKWARVPVTQEHPFGFRKEDFLRYVRAVVEHYKGKISYWEVWNEPYWWAGTAAYYGNLVKEVRQLVHEIAPGAKIIGPCCYPGGGFFNEWAENVAKTCGTGAFDVWSFHGYMNNYQPEEAGWGQSKRLDWLRGLMGQHGGEKPMWDTELQPVTGSFYTDRHRGWSLSHWSDRWADGREAARWFVGMYVVGLAHGVERFFTFPGYDTMTHASYIYQYQSHFDYDGAPKPAFIAQATMARFLSPAKFVREIPLGDRIRAYQFESNGRPLVVMWTLWLEGKQASLTVNLPMRSLEVYGIVGQKVKVKSAEGRTILPLSADPHYVFAPSRASDELAKAIANGQINGIISFDAAAHVVSPGGGPSAIVGAVRNSGSNQPVSATVSVISVSPGFSTEAEMSKISDIRLGQEKTGAVLLRVDKAGPRTGQVSCAITPEGEPESAKTFTISLLRADRIEKAPIIDGVLTDWPVEAALNLSDRKHVKASPQNWKGPEDCSAKLRVAHDGQSLFLAFEISDDVYVQDKPPNTWWAADCVEVFLDVSGLSTTRLAGSNVKRYQLGFVPRTADGGRVAWYQLLGDKIEDPNQIQVGGVIGEKGYNLEIRLGFGAFGKSSLASGCAVRFDVNVNDKDNPAAGNRSHVLVWSGDIENSQDGRKYGALILVP